MISIRVIDRPETEALHPTFLRWWQGHGWEGVPVTVLPRLGILAESEGRPVVAAWLYMDNSTGVSMLEWLVSDPDASPLVTARAISHAVRFAREHAKSIGYGVMLTSTRTPSLVRLLEKSGFTKTDEGVTHLLSIL